jgi:hypothetical protein
MSKKILSILSSILLIGIILIPSINSENTYQINLNISKDLILGEGLFNFYLEDQTNRNYNNISRDRIIEIAEGFLNHEWNPTEDNIFHGTYQGRKVDTPDRDTYTDWPDTHGWKANQTNYGLPYQWGGFSSISGYNLSNPQDFDEQYTGSGSYEGRIYFAGDINSEDYCKWTCGLDCSGFVSRCWNLPIKHATYTLTEIVSPISFEELKKGDILNIPRYHVILFKEFVNEDKTMIRTIECGGPAPNVNEHIYKITSIDDEGFSVTLEGYSVSSKFGMYRYEFIDNAPTTPTLIGPTSGNVNHEYSYTCFSTDPEGDMVSYCIDWGDDSDIKWFGPFNSGEIFNISHFWEKTGDYIARAKAKDINEIESGWATLEVSMPKNKSIDRINPWISRLIERFPILELLL